MTTNAFLLSWDMTGLEAVVPISQYEEHEHQNLVEVLAGKKKTKNPLNQIVFMMEMRARYNPQRHYEIYAIDCDHSFTADTWREYFNEHPQEAANIVRDRGVKIYSDRMRKGEVLIT